MAPKTILSMDGFQENMRTLKTVPKYDSSNESKTPHAWWDLDKPTFHSLLKEMSERVALCFQPETGVDRELQHVANTGSKLEQVERKPPMKVALIGAQGAGKSLLINALLDSSGLSLTGAGGFACTSAIVKYAYGPGDKYAAEVKFLNAKMREAMIDEHIRSYVDFHNDLEDSDDEDGGPRVRPHSQEEHDRKRKQTAEDFFDTIFGSRDEFLAAWSSNPVNTGEFKSLCQMKCKEAMERYDTDSREVIFFIKSTPAELLHQIKPFLSNVENEVCLWPIVDCVTIRLNHQLLHEGIEIVDLPGSGDVNMLRAKHADQIKDSVNAELILGDTGRIGTNDWVISAVRAGILNHGASNVKVVATKIDVLSDDELNKSREGLCEELRMLIEEAENDATAADAEDQDAKFAQINRYKQYLQRFLKAEIIDDRAKGIDMKFGTTLEALAHNGRDVEIVHTSTSDYMCWIKSDKIPFNSQPALSPEACGVPKIRRFLFDLPTSQNFKAYSDHIKFIVPAFVDKLQRVVTQSDRDAGFKTIANDFDDLRKRFLGDMVKQLEWFYHGYAISSIKKVKKDIPAYKASLKMKLEKQWLMLKAPAFNRILKGRGTVPQGTSKAQGLERTINWNAELAEMLKAGFQHWHVIHSKDLELLKAALPLQLDRLFHDTIDLINASQANLITIEKSKMKWKPYQHRLKSKVLALMDEMILEQQRFLNRITLKDERENNLIAAITDNIFDDVCVCAPPLKTTPPGKPKRYVSPVLKFRKQRLETHFLHENAHFIDRIIKLFEEQLEEKMIGLIRKHFAKIDASLQEFSRVMREHGPIDFTIDSRGESIRRELEKHIPFLEEKAEALRNLLPEVSFDDENNDSTDVDIDDGAGEVQDLKYFIHKVSKGKRGRGTYSASEPSAKRVKHEQT